MVETILQSTALLVVVAMLTEALTEIVKVMVPAKLRKQATYVLSITIGIILAIVLEVNLFGLDDVAGKYAGMIVAGILASRGANYVHGFLQKFDIIKPVK